MIEWLFFDLGSTLIDESDCVEYRIAHLLHQSGAPDREVLQEEIQRTSYRDAAALYGLDAAPWPCHLEKLYPQTKAVLAALQGKYKLGLIANQVPGVVKRLQKFGILEYFDVIASSGELGVAKPEPEIFQYALAKAACKAENAVMIGDRLDNDIVPAAKLGMKTVWIRQGAFHSADSERFDVNPDKTIDDLSNLPQILL